MSEARDRVERLVAAAGRLVEPSGDAGRHLRRVLRDTTGLSAEGIDYAIDHCLEVHPSESEMRQFCAAVQSAPCAHVILSANVFTATLRAIALALVASDRVFVRPSRREPHMAEHLCVATGGLFELVTTIEPGPADIVFAYGEDETLAAIRASLPEGSIFCGHGAGIGVAFVAPDRGGDWPERAASRLARDIVAFDQRGCLSPRIACVLGEAADGARFCDSIARELGELETSIPRGRLSSLEKNAIVRYRDTVAYAGQVFKAGSGWVGFDADGTTLLLPPVGRNLHVLRVDSVSPVCRALGDLVSAVGVSPTSLQVGVANLLPAARVSEIGHMQRPSFDGPVDRRSLPEHIAAHGVQATI